MRFAQLMLGLALALAIVACQPRTEAPPMENAATFTAEDEAAIRDGLQGYVADAKAGNWDALAGYFTEDAVRMPYDEPMIQGHAAIIEEVQTLPPPTEFTLTPQVIEGDGDLAWARGTFTFDVALPDGEPVSTVGKWQAVYERQADGSWLCVSDIWNSDTPASM